MEFTEGEGKREEEGLPNCYKPQVDMAAEKVVKEVAQHVHDDRGGGQVESGVDPMVEEEERRRRLRSMVAVAKPSPYTGATATAGRMGNQWHGPGSGCQADGEAAT
jgi:hypothetical protein